MADDSLGPLLDLDEVEVIGTEPFEADEMVRRGNWVCAACGERRDFEGSWRLTVRNRSGMRFERPVLVCSDCYRNLSIEDPS